MRRTTPDRGGRTAIGTSVSRLFTRHDVMNRGGAAAKNVGRELKSSQAEISSEKYRNSIEVMHVLTIETRGAVAALAIKRK